MSDFPNEIESLSPCDQMRAARSLNSLRNRFRCRDVGIYVGMLASSDAHFSNDHDSRMQLAYLRGAMRWQGVHGGSGLVVGGGSLRRDCPRSEDCSKFASMRESDPSKLRREKTGASIATSCIRVERWATSVISRWVLT